MSTGVPTIRRSEVGQSESPEQQQRQSIRSSSKGGGGETVKSLESDVKLEHILINKKAAEVSKIYLGRHVYMYLLIYRPDLLDYAELFAHLDECVYCAVEVFTIVTC